MTHPNITLSQTEKADLPTLFQFQLDEDANYLAAFTAKDSDNEAAYLEKYTRFLTNPTINNQTIRADGEIVGSIAKFVIENDAEITYWIDRKYWGQGIATAALRAFLDIEKTRPLYGRVAFDNHGSQKVLSKCGFVKIGTEQGFAHARQLDIKEYIYKLAD